MLLMSENILLVWALLLFVAVVAGKVAYRFGAPALLLFLGVGMLFGLDFISYRSVEMTQFIGMIALCIILFTGGMDTKFSQVRPIIAPGAVLATAGETDVLITGDMEREGELRLVETVALPDIEVLVAGHHGSDTSNTSELLEAVKPELVLISAGLNNEYGHPDWDTLVRLEEIGAEIYRTDLYGTIEVRMKQGDDYAAEK